MAPYRVIYEASLQEEEKCLELEVAMNNIRNALGPGAELPTTYQRPDTSKYHARHGLAANAPPVAELVQLAEVGDFEEVEGVDEAWERLARFLQKRRPTTHEMSTSSSVSAGLDYSASLSVGVGSA